MLCERCKHNQATMHYTQIINGSVTEYHLCEQCAREEKQSLAMHDFNMFDMFTPHREAVETELICPVCGTTLNEFRKTGIAGCPKCYEVFAPVIQPMLKQIHGCSVHVDEKEGAKSPEKQLELLKAELSKAVSAEEYEKAAKLRDEIKKLKGEN